MHVTSVRSIASFFQLFYRPIIEQMSLLLYYHRFLRSGVVCIVGKVVFTEYQKQVTQRNIKMRIQCKTLRDSSNDIIPKARLFCFRFAILYITIYTCIVNEQLSC